MKKKFIIFTLVFTLIFSSLNYKKSYADGGLISLPILATVSSLAVGTGIVISNNDDLYNMGRLFYDYVDKHNTLTWQTVQSVFTSSVSLQANKLVSVKSDFLHIVKDFFDAVFNNEISSPMFSYPHWVVFTKKYTSDFSDMLVIFANDFYGSPVQFSGGLEMFRVINGVVTGSSSKQAGYLDNSIPSDFSAYSSNNIVVQTKYKITNLGIPKFITGTFDYSGGYTWDNVENKKENESIALPIPGDLSHLVGQGSTDFWDNTDGLVGGGDISIPNVDNPSIGLDDVITFPNVSNPDFPGVDDPSVPNDSIWSNITDYIVGLVVPHETFWTDTWGGLYNNFTNSFPMVDMDGFNDLVTGEKKFPNIDINIMGVKGRVVNGDIVNSIVNWLRPIIAGFMMLCLMFFNYRKIYKLIRNSEPFEGIGKVENHAN